jgi:hypothetical protein
VVNYSFCDYHSEGSILIKTTNEVVDKPTKLAWRLKPQLQKQNLPPQVKKTLIFSRVRAYGLCLFSREFYSPGLKLTLMTAVRPYGGKFTKTRFTPKARTV